MGWFFPFAVRDGGFDGGVRRTRGGFGEGEHVLLTANLVGQKELSGVRVFEKKNSPRGFSQPRQIGNCLSPNRRGTGGLSVLTVQFSDLGSR